MTSEIELSEAKRQLLQKRMSGAGPAPAREVAGVVPRSFGEIIPLSSEQGQVWLHAAMSPDVPIYNESITIDRRGSFDLDVLERSFNEILRRHEIWRTSFEIVDDQIVQIVHPHLTVRLTLYDLTSLPSTARNAEALRMATEDARRPINLHAAPLFRARVMKLAEDEHCLYLTVHHIIFDGVSIYRLFVPELSAIYDAYSCGACSPLPEPALQYGDYAIWRQQQVASDRMERQLEYWRRAMSRPLPKLELDADHPRPLVPTYRGSMETFTLSLELTTALKALSRIEGATLYMALLAAFKTMLFRYSGQQDLVIGGVTDLRRRPELAQLMGYFLNTMALRTHPAVDLTFRQYLAQVRTSVLGALEASEVPFACVVPEFAVGRDSSPHPLFQVLFSIEPPFDAFPEGWGLSQTDVKDRGAKFDLHLELDERPPGMIGRFIYSKDLFEADTIRRMIGHWQAILKGVVADPCCALGRLPMITPQESRRILVEWNATDADYPRDACVHELFEAQAARTPDAIAVEHDDERLTYSELNARANRLARRLRTLGVKPDDRVGICVDRGLEMVVGVMAVLKAGGAYVPLDPGYPAERLAYLLGDSAPIVVLTHERARAALSGALAGLPDRPPLLDLDLDLTAEAPLPVTNLDPADLGLASSHLAYVIYTSGSTGKPKGVMIEHRNVVNLTQWARTAFSHKVCQTTLFSTSLSFDLSIFEIFAPLVRGHKIIIVGNLLDKFANTVTLINTVPSSMDGLLAKRSKALNSIQGVNLAGEPLNGSLVDRIFATTSVLEIRNLYGPTETTVYSTCLRMDRSSGFSPLIGRPISNTRIYILDRHREPVPLGAAGEIYIGGAGVARGYLNRPELTEERFLASPFVAGDRLYRTGDLGRYRTDGNIEFLGRNDFQVKIRGFRIELGEIEARLAQHPGVRDTVVLAREDAPGDKRLVAYYTAARDSEAPAAEALRAHLALSLPDHMVPAAYVRLEALPLTTNGKLDRGALPAPRSDAYAARGDEPPRGKTEEVLARIWADALKLERIGRHDNFFELGGHSLLGLRLMFAIKKVFGETLPIGVLFSEPTVAGLAHRLDHGGETPAFMSVVPLHTSGPDPPIFMVHLIERDLARHLGRRRPVYGLSFGLAAACSNSEIHPPQTIESVAAHYIGEMRSVQPRGPYHLIGHSIGGVVAYEIAQQLIVSGDSVAFLGLIDSAAPDPLQKQRRQTLVQICRQLLKAPPKVLLTYIIDRIVSVPSVRHAMIRLLPTQSSFNFRLHAVSVTHYSPKPYPGRVHLIQASVPGLYIRDEPPPSPEVGWKGLALGGLTVHRLLGGHFDVVTDPLAAVTAEAIESGLNASFSEL